jgi:hypothetical protein
MSDEHALELEALQRKAMEDDLKDTDGEKGQP